MVLGLYPRQDSNSSPNDPESTVLATRTPTPHAHIFTYVQTFHFTVQNTHSKYKKITIHFFATNISSYTMDEKLKEILSKHWWFLVRYMEPNKEMINLLKDGNVVPAAMIDDIQVSCARRHD